MFVRLLIDREDRAAKRTAQQIPQHVAAYAASALGGADHATLFGVKIGSRGWLSAFRTSSAGLEVTLPTLPTMLMNTHLYWRKRAERASALNDVSVFPRELCEINDRYPLAYFSSQAATD